MTMVFNIKMINHLNGFSLQSLDLSIRFIGNASLQNIPEHIPIQVSVHLVDEWVDKLYPVVEALPADDVELEEDLSPEMFPFLPLPPRFNPDNGLQWQSLAKEIKYWLLQDPAFDVTHPGYYFLMREFFWMAFVAAYPTFPHGQWLCWDPQIPMHGCFISDWIADLDEATAAPMPATIHDSIWQQLKAAIEELSEVAGASGIKSETTNFNVTHQLLANPEMMPHHTLNGPLNNA
ncbi:hypothetical protein BDN67DRAFT_984988 [Paxillus ammoniavirescens]|nr:hypothetical protein BDN67DRAFT_984988 [Paxillus ammoniavirescens]